MPELDSLQLAVSTASGSPGSRRVCECYRFAIRILFWFRNGLGALIRHCLIHSRLPVAFRGRGRFRDPLAGSGSAKLRHVRFRKSSKGITLGPQLNAFVRGVTAAATRAIAGPGVIIAPATAPTDWFVAPWATFRSCGLPCAKQSATFREVPSRCCIGSFEQFPAVVISALAECFFPEQRRRVVEQPACEYRGRQMALFAIVRVDSSHSRVSFLKSKSGETTLRNSASRLLSFTARSRPSRLFWNRLDMVGHLNAPPTRAMILGVSHPYRVSAPNAHKSPILVGDHRNALAVCHAGWVANDHCSVGWRCNRSHGQGACKLNSIFASRAMP
jgi:hypothetical protein